MEKGHINLDWGGGKYEKATEWLRDRGVTNLVYDPYNRSPEHNHEVLTTCRRKAGADSGTLCNVLCVIPEVEDRIEAVRGILSYLREDAPVIIQSYIPRDRTEPGPTRDGWQNGFSLDVYAQEIEDHLKVPMEVRDGFIILTNTYSEVDVPRVDKVVLMR